MLAELLGRLADAARRGDEGSARDVVGATVTSLGEACGFPLELESVSCEGDIVAFARGDGGCRGALAMTVTAQLYAGLETADEPFVDAAVFVYLDGRRVAPESCDYCWFMLVAGERGEPRWESRGWMADEHGEYEARRSCD